MSYIDLSHRLVESKEAHGELKVKYKDSLAKRKELVEQLLEFNESSSSDEENIDVLVNEVEKLNDNKTNLRRELEDLTIRIS